MSFILDALKKSETERQQQSNSEFSGVPTSSSTAPVPRWLWVVGALLAINLAVLAGLLLQPESTPEHLAMPTLPLPNLPADQAPPQTASEPSFAEQVAVARQNLPQPQPAEFDMTESVTKVAAVKPEIISQDPSAIRSTEVYPTIYEVIASGAITLPELHLDIHVYSEAADDRFVFINMSKYREGGQLSEGPVVAEITPQGVVLGHRGQSFLLPRE